MAVLQRVAEAVLPDKGRIGNIGKGAVAVQRHLPTAHSDKHGGHDRQRISVGISVGTCAVVGHHVARNRRAMRRRKTVVPRHRRVIDRRKVKGHSAGVAGPETVAQRVAEAVAAKIVGARHIAETAGRGYGDNAALHRVDGLGDQRQRIAVGVAVGTIAVVCQQVTGDRLILGAGKAVVLRDRSVIAGRGVGDRQRDPPDVGRQASIDQGIVKPVRAAEPGGRGIGKAAVGVQDHRAAGVGLQCDRGDPHRKRIGHGARNNQKSQVISRKERAKVAVAVADRVEPEPDPSQQRAIGVIVGPCAIISPKMAGDRGGQAALQGGKPIIGSDRSKIDHGALARFERHELTMEWGAGNRSGGHTRPLHKRCQT